MWTAATLFIALLCASEVSSGELSALRVACMDSSCVQWPPCMWVASLDG